MPSTSFVGIGGSRRPILNQGKEECAALLMTTCRKTSPPKEGTAITCVRASLLPSETSHSLTKLRLRCNGSPWPERRSDRPDQLTGVRPRRSLLHRSLADKWTEKDQEPGERFLSSVHDVQRDMSQDREWELFVSGKLRASI